MWLKCLATGILTKVILKVTILKVILKVMILKVIL